MQLANGILLILHVYSNNYASVGGATRHTVIVRVCVSVCLSVCLSAIHYAPRSRGRATIRVMFSISRNASYF